MKSITSRYRYRRWKKILKYIIFNQKKTERVFCLSMQKTGTTSVGQFLRDFGFNTVGWYEDERNGWSNSWYEDDYESIFSSIDFKSSDACEDSPWWMPDFYKVLFKRFPQSKFILLTRDPDSWFRSMQNHANGMVIGVGKIHCKIYGREQEYLELLNSGELDEIEENKIISKKKMKITLEHANHYKDIYQKHNMEVQDFFRRNAPHNLHVGKLEDPDKWKKMGKFLGIDVPANYQCHKNITNPL